MKEIQARFFKDSTYFVGFPLEIKTSPKPLTEATLLAFSRTVTLYPRSESWSQFHQHLTNSFCANILLSKKLQSQTVNRVKQFKTLL
jgi:hypothetical protein